MTYLIEWFLVNRDMALLTPKGKYSFYSYMGSYPDSFTVVRGIGGLNYPITKKRIPIYL